jgi:hypothetical protein
MSPEIYIQFFIAAELLLIYYTLFRIRQEAKKEPKAEG